MREPSAPVKVRLVMRTFTSQATAQASPDDVLAVLRCVDAARRWAPVPFDVEGLRGDVLYAGAHPRVSGRLAGRAVGFDVEVHEADDERLRLSASGPVSFDVCYDVEPREDGARISASVSVRPGRGLLGRVTGSASEALLSAGALRQAVDRIAREAEGLAPSRPLVRSGDAGRLE